MSISMAVWRTFRQVFSFYVQHCRTDHPSLQAVARPSIVKPNSSSCRRSWLELKLQLCILCSSMVFITSSYCSGCAYIYRAAAYSSGFAVLLNGQNRCFAFRRKTIPPPVHSRTSCMVFIKWVSIRICGESSSWLGYSLHEGIYLGKM
jgi:hypothetical protein